MGERSCSLSSMIRLYLGTLSGNVYIPVHGVTPDFLRQRHCCFYLLSRGLSNWPLIFMCVVRVCACVCVMVISHCVDCRVRQQFSRITSLLLSLSCLRAIFPGLQLPNCSI